MASGSSPHVLIVGAGLGGLTLAQALRKKGISYEIFERDNSATERAQGWAIGIHTMLDDLKASIPDDMPPIKNTSHLMPLRLVPQFAVYAETSAEKLGVQDDGSGGILRAHRDKLREWLSTNIPVQYGKRAVRVEETGQSVTMHFQDGTSARGDVVVGAEGAHSVVRRHILQDEVAMDTEPIAVISADFILRGRDMEEQLEMGHSGYVVGYTDSDGVKVHNFAGLSEVLPDGKSGKYYFHCFLRDESARHEGHWTQTATQEELLAEARRKTKNLPAKFRTLIDRAQVEGVRVPPLRLYTLVIDQMPTGRATLLGDAAHAMTPFRGQGGVHAMIDGLKLADAIEKINFNSEQSVKECFAEYQDEMLDRGSKAARESQRVFVDKPDGGMKGPEFLWGKPVAPLPKESIRLQDIFMVN